jgi:hypothetical protein
MAMNLKPSSLWDQMQMALLRMFTLLLGLLDGVLNVHWGERLLERLAHRWQARLVQLDKDIAHLEQERARLRAQAEALAIHAAAIYLGGRSLTHNELCFDPADPHDEEMLDATIDLLVKQRLASIEMQEIEPGHYVYRLELDWMAIHTRLSNAADQAGLEMEDWFREGLKFIDEAFLSEVAP